MGCAVIRQEQMHGLIEGPAFAQGYGATGMVWTSTRKSTRLQQCVALRAGRVSRSLSDAVGGGLIPTHPSAFARGYGGTSEVVFDDSANNTYDQ